VKLALGPLARTDSIKVTVALPYTLKEELDKYAEVHSTAWGQKVEAADLIPHMLAQFLSKDRQFRKAIKDKRLSRSP
jgi:hypothetical protein